MKLILTAILWVLWALSKVFLLTSVITHIWTTIIAIKESGFWGAVATFVLPMLSEFYWMFMMFGENDAYAYTALTHIILAFLFTFLNEISN